MLDQKYDIDLYDECFPANERLTHISKAREQILGRLKGEESPSVQGPKYSEEDLVVK